MDHTQAELVTLNQERFLHIQQEIVQLRQEMQRKDVSSSMTTVTATPQSEYLGASSSVSVLQTELRLKATSVLREGSNPQYNEVSIDSM